MRNEQQENKVNWVAKRFSSLLNYSNDLSQSLDMKQIGLKQGIRGENGQKSRRPSTATNRLENRI